MRVVEQVMHSSATMQLLTRAEKCIVNEETLVLSENEAGLAQTVQELFELDLSELGAWTEAQKVDLRTGLSYLRQVLKSRELLDVSLTSGKQRQAVPKGRGFGGSGAAKAGAKRTKKKKR